jgi:hypothetical protein
MSRHFGTTKFSSADHGGRYVCRATEMIDDGVRAKGFVARTPFIEKLVAHGEALVRTHNVRVRACRTGSGGAASYGQRQVECAPITDEASYSTFLHEMGHLLSPEGDSRQHRHVIVKDFAGIAGDSLVSIGGECGAWAWAIRNAETWTRAMHDDLVDGLSHYARYANGERERDCLRGAVIASSCLIAGDITPAELRHDFDRVSHGQ